MFRESLPERREARRLLVGVLLSAIGRGLTLPFLFIYLTDVRAMTDASAGLAIGWFGAVVMLLAPVGGSLMDRFGARPVALFSQIGQAVGSVLLAFAVTPALALLALTVIAVGSASTWASNATMLASLTGEGERQRVFGVQFALLNLGIGVGGLIAGAFVDVHRPVTFQLIYLLDGVTFLVPLAILLAMPAVGRRAAAPGRSETEAGGYREVFRDRAFRRVFLFGLVLTTFGYGQIEVGFPAFAVRAVGTGTRVVAWAMAANTIAIVVAQLLVIRHLQGRSRSRALAVTGAVFAISWLVLGAGALAGDQAPLLAAVLVIACSAIFGLGETLLQPVQPALVNTLAPDRLRGRYNAANSMIFGISSVIGPVTAGPLIGAGHATVWVLLTIGGCLLASLVALSLRPLLTRAQDGRPDRPSEVLSR
ncbi:MFS transporter [Actinoplanes regularis]|uniref:Na+/melibiose symporter n=1 Tax=Actinoplanes regularis TaxID=52697 RepID=A0A239DVF6_9ACTN|nr:MFS transporter [Actinoplanes regularis]GIE88979.1 MFS transporter [Actinoplanes regularis]GLW35024.1 MFS transporter [Actinoplanes regularis]SNS36575.1 Na+/melibiose symporter [Actinoplanes regularis]